MADVKISELTEATSVDGSEVAPIVQGGVTKKVAVSLLGSFLDKAIARVDASGSDSTGVVGDLSLPFLTVQGALNYLEANGGNTAFASPVIDVGNYDCIGEHVTTSLSNVVFKAVWNSVNVFNSLVTTATDDYVQMSIQNASVGTSITGQAAIRFSVEMQNSFAYDVTCLGGALVVTAETAIGVLSGTITNTGRDITLRNLSDSFGYFTINSVGSNVSATDCLIGGVTACNVLTLIDSRVDGTNSASSTVYADVILKGIATTAAPAAANSTGTTGQVAWSSGFIYVCIAPNTWKRVAVATWP